MLGTFLKHEYEELIAQKDWESLRVAFEEMGPADIAEVLHDLPPEDSGVIFRLLPRSIAGDAFEYLPLEQQAALVSALGSEQLVTVLNEMAPDDRTRLFEELPAEVTKRALAQLNPGELKVARQLLGYPDKTAGRYMTPEYLAIRPDLTAAQALEFIRKHGRGAETLNVLYVTDEKGRLQYDVRLASIVLAPPETKIADLSTRQMVAIPATAPREDVVQAFEKYDRTALPVIDSQGVLVGIITHDDVLDVAEQEATEDIQRLGGVEALEAPYMDLGAWDMFKKRGTWLAVLMVGEMLTTTAMGYFEEEIERAVVLALFIPLIISSGGNSGSQATSLVIRALALREIELKDWWKVAAREVRSGLMLGGFLGVIGFARIYLWPNADKLYSVHYPWVAVTVAASLVGVVLFGALTGSMLPFLLSRLKLDPATASAPFVATLVDVTGLIIYFTLAAIFLRGILL